MDEAKVATLDGFGGRSGAGIEMDPGLESGRGVGSMTSREISVSRDTDAAGFW